MSDEELLSLAQQDNTFIGEEYRWNGKQRVVRNSVKTVAKLKLALRADRFSCRSFASVASLVMYAIHTTRLNPADAFALQYAYRAMFRLVDRGWDWDDEVPYVGYNARQCLRSVGERLVENTWCCIADTVAASYQDEAHDAICYTDASVHGWREGAVVRHADGTTDTFQQWWVSKLMPQRSRTVQPPQVAGPDPLPSEEWFTARHSAHAEPRAAMLVQRYLLTHGLVTQRGPGLRIALVTDHHAIVHAQRKHNGFGGIGRGHCLNRLFTYTTDLLHTEGTQVVFFYIVSLP